jgi:hypothetical protein
MAKREQLMRVKLRLPVGLIERSREETSRSSKSSATRRVQGKQKR